MTLYCFIFGMAAFAAVRENKQFLYGAFCILLAVLTNFQRAGFECVFTVLVLLAVQNPQGVGPAENQKFAQAVEFVGAGSFWLYLAHPLVLELLPNTAMGGAAAWLCFAGVYAVCLMVCYALYTLLCAGMSSALRNHCTIFAAKRQSEFERSVAWNDKWRAAQMGRPLWHLYDWKSCALIL